MKYNYKILIVLSTAIIALAPNIFINAQSTTKVQDSLVRILPTLGDSAKIATLRVVSALSQIPQERIAYAKELIAEAKRQGDIENIARGKTSLVNFYFGIFPDSVVIAAKDAGEYCLRNKQYYYYFKTMDILCNSYMLEGLYNHALKVASDCYVKAKEMKQPDHIVAIGASVLGKSYKSLERREKAIEYLRESSRLLGLSSEDIMLVENYQNISDSYLGDEKYREALGAADTVKLLLKGRPAHCSSIKKISFDSELNYTICYSRLKETAAAKKHLDKALQIFRPEWP